MSRPLQLWFLSALSVAIGCEQVFGLKYTSSAQSAGTSSSTGTDLDAGAGGVGASSGGIRTDAGIGGRGVGAGDASADGLDGGAPTAAAGTVSAGVDGIGAGAGGVAAGTNGGAAGLDDTSAGTNGGAAGLDDTSAGTNGVSAGAGGAGTVPAVVNLASDRRVAIWLDASSGATTNDTQGVTAWKDRSANAHSAVLYGADTNRAPNLIPNAFGSHPAIRFDGTDDKLTVSDSSELQLGRAPFVLDLVVSNRSSKCCLQFIFTKVATSGDNPGLIAAVNWFLSVADPTPPPSTEFVGILQIGAQSGALVSTPFSDTSNYADDELRVISILRTESDVSIRVNGQVLGSVPNLHLDVSAPGGDLVIGGHPWADGGADFSGSIAEIVFARDLAFDEVRAVEAVLMNKYADVL